MKNYDVKGVYWRIKMSNASERREIWRETKYRAHYTRRGDDSMNIEYWNSNAIVPLSTNFERVYRYHLRERENRLRTLYYWNCSIQSMQSRECHLWLFDKTDQINFKFNQKLDMLYFSSSFTLGCNILQILFPNYINTEMNIAIFIEFNWK